MNSALQYPPIEEAIMAAIPPTRRRLIDRLYTGLNLTDAATATRAVTRTFWPAVAGTLMVTALAPAGAAGWVVLFAGLFASVCISVALPGRVRARICRMDPGTDIVTISVPEALVVAEDERFVLDPQGTILVDVFRAGVLLRRQVLDCDIDVVVLRTTLSDVETSFALALAMNDNTVGCVAYCVPFAGNRLDELGRLVRERQYCVEDISMHVGDHTYTTRGTPA